MGIGMIKLIRLSTLIVIFYALTVCSFADEIILKNGQRLVGVLTAQHDDTISFEIYYESVAISSVIKKSDIQELIMSESDVIDESVLFEITQKAKGRMLYKGRWLPNKHVSMLIAREKKMDIVKKLVLFSIKFFIFFLICFSLIMGIDFFNYELRKFRLKRISNLESADHRLHKRIFQEFRFKYVLPNGKTKKAKTLNMSLGGLCFLSNVEFQISDKLKVELEVGGDKKNLFLEGLVVRKEKDPKSQKHNIGLSFVGLSHKTRQLVAQIISEARHKK